VTRTWDEVARTFEDAAALAPEERARFLDTRCGEDVAFRRDVESLLEQDAVAVGYLEPPEAIQSARLHGPSEGAVVGGFTLLGRLGSGGMGIVHEAQQTNPERRVALKFLPPLSAAPGVRARFELEGVLLGRMNHPSIAHVYAAGVDGHTPFIAMELVVSGVSITAYARRRSLSVAQSIALVRRVCAAVAHAHAKGIIHRDLKPGNVLVDESGAPKLIDFGVARALDEAEGGEQSLTRTGDLLGTLQYLSPEQADGARDELDAQTDVHALGLILYEILCGRRAHEVEGKTLTQALRWIAEETVPLARSVRPELPAELEWILAKALETDRARRYANVVELDRDLERFLVHEPVLAGPRSRAYELRLWARRHPTATAVLALGAVSVVAVVALALTTLARQREVFRLADAERLRDLERRAAAQWPATPDRIPALEAWLDEAHDLAAKLVEHRATLAELRTRALPRTADEAREEAESHPEAAALATLRDRIEHQRRTHARRTGGEPQRMPEPDLAAYKGLEDWVTLNSIAFHLVTQESMGAADPAIAQALAQRALEIEGSHRGAVLDTIAWAHYAAGEDEAAQAYAERAEAEDPDDEELVASIRELVERSSYARSPKELEAAAARIAQLEDEAAGLERIVGERRRWNFADETDGWWHDRLAALITSFERFADPTRGLITGRSPENGLGIESRLALAREVARLSLEEPAEAWRTAIAAITANPRYQGFVLRAQSGLVPLGTDPDSKLEEFADIATGAVPARAENGRLMLTAESAVAFVLVPPGRFLLGAQAVDETKDQYDPAATAFEVPLRRMELAAYFLAKHELTQAQWLRATGSNPSRFPDGSLAENERITGMHPVESVSWHQCAEFARRQGWQLPTEAQWEYAARGDTTTPWWTGTDAASLQGAANLSDAHSRSVKLIAQHKYEMAIDDGRLVHAPIGSYRANPFGLHDVSGNVFEWCADWFAMYSAPRRPEDGLVLQPSERVRISRGGGYENDALSLRSSKRGADKPEQIAGSIGLRPARAIQP